MLDGAGRDVTSRFNNILYIGSLCGIVELMRNSLNLWAKCFNHQKLAIAFSILGFITAFLFLLNFILMQLWRFEHLGRVCSGDFLLPGEAAESPYMPMKGYFIRTIIFVIYGMFMLVFISILCLAATLKYQRARRQSLAAMPYGRNTN